MSFLENPAGSAHDLDGLVAWLDGNMPQAFYSQVSVQERELIAGALLSFRWQEGFATLESSARAYCLCLNQEHTDLQVLERFKDHEIRDYHTFVSTSKLTFLGYDERLRIIVLTFLEGHPKLPLTSVEVNSQNHIYEQLKKIHPQLSFEQFQETFSSISSDFLKLLSDQSLLACLDLLLRPLWDDFIEVQSIIEEHWQIRQRPSLQLVISVPLVRISTYLSKLAWLVERRGLFLRRVNATHLSPFESGSRLLIILAVHGKQMQPAWNVTSIHELVHEISMLRLSSDVDILDKLLVDTSIVKAYQVHVIRSAALICHQFLASFDSDIYTYDTCLEAFCRHPELTQLLIKTFEARLHPTEHNTASYTQGFHELKTLIAKLDTGQPFLDQRRKVIFELALDWVNSILKTNFWRLNKLGVCYRLSSEILQKLPYDTKQKFPDSPFAIFFHYGFGSFGFHLRFRDLARGGMRSVLPRTLEQYKNEQIGLFQEAYNLAYTQQKKNKDIPEGGAKAVILCLPYAMTLSEKTALQNSWRVWGQGDELIEKKLTELEKQRSIVYLHQLQKAFIESLLTLVNTSEDGTLKANDIVDYYKQSEDLFLGPDENMHNEILVWIEQYSRRCGYRPGGAFISSHPIYGINHKQYGVTSLGLHTYLKEGLHYLGIDPFTEPFTVKISGGPDGDVAGNAIIYLARDFPKTAKLIALTDVSGTIFDPQGLDFSCLEQLFTHEQAICHYPPQKLHDGGFLLDRTHVNDEGLTQKTRLWKSQSKPAMSTWISSSEASQIFRQNVHHTVADVFIPGGGRPRALNHENVDEFFVNEKPTARLIVEGANLYVAPEAREKLEEAGVLIFRDSSANKGGVMSSSLEVLMRLILSPQEMQDQKPQLVEAILQTIEDKARLEAQLLLREHQRTGKSLCQLSEEISNTINTFTDDLRRALQDRQFCSDVDDPLNQAWLNYVPSYLRMNYLDRLVKLLPQSYKRAMLATHLACQLVYEKGPDWRPTLASSLPLLLDELIPSK